MQKDADLDVTGGVTGSPDSAGTYQVHTACRASGGANASGNASTVGIGVCVEVSAVLCTVVSKPE